MTNVEIATMTNAEMTNGITEYPEPIKNPKYKFKVIIIGAGLGGCANAMAMHYQGFDVVMYEKVREFQRLGDSLGLGENALKLLRRWGVDKQIIAIGNKSPTFTIRRWYDGKEMTKQRLMDMAGYIGHRGDYHHVFLDRVRELGIPLHMGTEVMGFNEYKPSVFLKDGTEVDADIILGADGIKSKTRELVLGFKDAPKSSGYACYRAFFPGDWLKDDPLCAHFVEKDMLNVYIGEDMHMIQNTLKDGKEFNWIMTHKDDGEIGESWQQPGNIADVHKLVEGWSPDIVAAVHKMKECLDWKICYRDPLPTWVSRSGLVALTGDSAHPHLPTSAQGASQATEDGAVLALCLLLAGKGNVPLATRTYERLRYDRVRMAQLCGEDLRDRWHNALKQVNKGEEINPESLHMRNAWLYPHDAEADTLERWAKVSAEVAKEMAEGKDWSNKLPDYPTEVKSNGPLGQEEGESAAISSLPVSASP